jgi:DNA helicase HerA-like ATPase
LEINLDGSQPSMSKLRMSLDLSLPLDAVTQKIAFIGRTGSGKTYAATKLAELFGEAGAQFVALDPVGKWWSLRLRADGKPSGLDVPVFGGLHGDLPLEPLMGARIADLIVDRQIAAVLDVSQFEHNTDKARFAEAFATRLFYRKKSAPSAIHLFVEEAQEFIPQNPQGEEKRMLGAFERIVKLGRNFGIGASLISQRPQEVNKKALNQTECLFVFQTTGTHERKAIDAWIADKGIDEDDRAMSKEDVAANCDPPYEAGGGGFNNALSRLRTLGIIEGRSEINLTEQLRG